MHSNIPSTSFSLFPTCYSKINLTLSTLVILLTISTMIESRAVSSDENNLKLCGRRLIIKMLHICDKTTPLRCLELDDSDDENHVNEQAGKNWGIIAEYP
uniref:Uncharacterized protein n=1 Tax=Panagrolaimus sp. JU765 TaxID=591449 RepID=A0AC34QZ69_9BILA